LKNGVVVPSNPACAEELANLNVYGPDDKKLTFEDGEIYLRKLEFLYSGIGARGVLKP